MLFDHDYQTYPELTNPELEILELTSPHPQIKGDFQATVVKVHDGDTVSLHVPWRDFDFPIRFADIDAPELSEGGEETRDWLNNLILNEVVLVKIDKKNRVDKYGRLLGTINYRGLDIGPEEINLGLAVVYGRKKEAEPKPLEKIFSLKQWITSLEIGQY